MKNGVSVAGMSEAMHEIKQEPRQGSYQYASVVHKTRGDSKLQVKVLSANIGTIKSARSFKFEVVPVQFEDEKALEQDCPYLTPEELALISIGACAMASMVKGLAAKGVALDFFDFKLSANLMGSYALGKYVDFKDIKYLISCKTDNSDEASILKNVINQISMKSPNHRTLVEHNDLSFVFNDEKIESVAQDSSSLELFESTLNAAIVWQYGFHIKGKSSVTGCELDIDQPKQSGGLDIGLNPQEALLSAMCASLVEGITKNITGYEGDITVKGQGYVDMRGLMGIDPDVLIKMQGLSFTVSLEQSNIEKAVIKDVLKNVIQESSVLNFISKSHKVHIDLDIDNDIVFSMISN